jgi:pepsin A
MSKFTEDLYLDEVTFGGITADNQTVGSVISSTPAGNVIPHDGIVGFAGQIVSGFNSTPFFHTLCAENAVKECRFGLALKQDGTGKMVLGEADKNLYKGELSVAPIIEEWFLTGDVALNSQVIAPNAFIELDSGTANIIGPISVVQQIFNASGVTYELVNQTGCAPTLVGTYPCSQPPELGFGFPSSADASQSAAAKNTTVSTKSTIFDVAAASFSSNSTDGICTSVLAGQDIILPQAPNQPLWVVGQPWFQTHYLDFNVGDGTVGVADQSY